jgi:prepilin-type processing-associated H-X9-DG protein
VNMDKVQTTWDLDLAPYLDGGAGKDDSGEAASKAQRHFLCPSDKMTHSGVARSYAMSGHDMSPQNWPAAAEAVTGVGLKWDKAAVQTLLDEKALGTPEALPRVKVSDIPRPARTVLVAEYIAAENTMGKFASATVSGGAQQLQGSQGGGVHRWRFNYLMVDGHVESFSPLQSGSLDGKGGIWTIKQEN